MLFPCNAKKSVLWLAMSACCALAAFSQPQPEWTNVFNGTNLNGLKMYKAADGDGAATIANGIITVTGRKSYLATEKEYSHFRTRVEWNNAGGNSGMLFHIGADKIWPLGLECQMQSADVGSLWTTGATRFNSTGTGDTYSPTGKPIISFGPKGTERVNFKRSEEAYTGNGKWNVWEMYVNNDSLEITVNEKVIMRVWKITADGKPLVKGRIALQIEGATVQWRNWKIQDYSATTSITLAPREKSNGLQTLRFDATNGRMQIVAPAGRFLDFNGRSLFLLPNKVPKN